MADLVDYLRDRLAECQCTIDSVYGRTTVGCVNQKRWQPSCTVHPTAEECEADNRAAREWLWSLPEPDEIWVKTEPIRRRWFWWWRR